ncbi:MAG: ribosome-associated heat shock protein Hsp15 [Acidobacteriota bacterium]|jgi:ribosome-associated heat shock protein Hsp15|nr:ribosome-associated heat shock protein Hsp15 [Acidobacteriota bacterium]
MSARLDKWLHVACVFKTRSQATRAVDLNRVRVNGEPVKPHRNLVPGDRIEVVQGDWTRVLVVKELRDKSVSKEEARTLYEDLSPPRPSADPMKRLLLRPPALRERGAGRPTKKERRDMERFGEGGEDPYTGKE